MERDTFTQLAMKFTCCYLSLWLNGRLNSTSMQSLFVHKYDTKCCDVTAVKVISMFGYFKASEEGILRHHYHERVFFLIYSIRFVLTRLQMEVALSILFELYLVFALK